MVKVTAVFAQFDLNLTTQSGIFVFWANFCADIDFSPFLN